MDQEESYRILDVSPSASPADIKLAYRRLAKVWHPDRFAEDTELQAMATAKLAAINQAYAYLKDRNAAGSGNVSTAKETSGTQQASPATQSPFAAKIRVTLSKEPRSPAEMWYDYGLDCFQRGQYTAATQYLADAIACDRYYLAAYELRYEALMQLGFEYRAKHDLLKIQELRHRFQRDQQVVRDREQPVKPPASPPSPPNRPAKPKTVPQPAASPTNGPSPPPATAASRGYWKGQVRWLVMADPIAAAHALSRTGRLAVVSEGGLVLLLEKGTGREYWRQHSGFSGGICTALNPSERILAIADPQTPSILLLDLKNGKPIRRLMSFGLGARSLLFDPFGKTLIAGCDDRLIRCWDIHSGNLKYQVSGHGAVPESLALNQQDQQIWCAGAETPLRLRRLDDGKLVRSMRGHEANTAIALSGNGQRLAVAGLAKLSILDLANRSCLHTFSILGPVKQVGFVGMDHLIVLLRNGDLLTLNLPSKAVVQQINGSYTGFTLAPGGRELVLVDRGGHVDIWTPSSIAP